MSGVGSAYTNLGMKEIHLFVRVWAPLDMSESDVVYAVQNALECCHGTSDFAKLQDPEVYLDDEEEDDNVSE